MVSPSKKSVKNQDFILSSVLNKKNLRIMAGVRSYERGVIYFKEKRVRGIAERNGTVVATVRGTWDYHVRLWHENANLAYSCTCPYAADGNFCKHCVAVGLEWDAMYRDSEAGSSRKIRKPAVTMDDAETYLSGLDKQKLVDMLMDQAMNDDRLRERLLMKTARQHAKGIDLNTFRTAIDNAVYISDFIHYSEAYGYTQGIEEVIDSIEELLNEGYGDEVIELTEYALDGIEEAMELIDDSDGNMGYITERFQEIHLQACIKAKPEPEILAKRLFKIEMNSDWEIFCDAAERYADVLGEKGLAVYRECAEKIWASMKPLKSGEDDSEMYGRRFRITKIMEALASQSGDIETLVAVKSRDLSYAYSYLQIATIYKDAHIPDKALEWAEKGIKAFPKRTDSRLRDFLAEEYHRRKRYEEEMKLIWADFTDSPGLAAYQKLKKHADRIHEWPSWREKALKFIREDIDKGKREADSGRWPWNARDSSPLVEIFMWEKDIEAAWREAKKGGCSNNLWLKLADKRSKDHPEDAVPIYQKHVEYLIGLKKNETYKEAVQFMRKINGLMNRLEQKEQFACYLESIRTSHKLKRNFIKLLNNAKWQ